MGTTDGSCSREQNHTVTKTHGVSLSESAVNGTTAGETWGSRYKANFLLEQT